MLRSPGAELSPNQCATRVLETPGLTPSQSREVSGQTVSRSLGKGCKLPERPKAQLCLLPTTHCKHKYTERQDTGLPAPLSRSAVSAREDRLPLLGHVLCLRLPIRTACLTQWGRPQLHTEIPCGTLKILLPGPSHHHTHTLPVSDLISLGGRHGHWDFFKAPPGDSYMQPRLSTAQLGSQRKA